jgi:hypothetical protein
MLEKAFAKQGSIPEHHTFHITYEEGALCEMHDKIVAEVVLPISEMGGRALSQPFKDYYFAKLMTAFSLPIFTSSLFFKHKAYENEKEYRFMQLIQADKPPGNIKYRKRPYSLARFREFDWRSVAGSALREIVIGPAADRPIARRFAEECLRAYHEPGVEIKGSKIPYRSPLPR